ncbi:MAG TPA: hypothetical protein PKV73_01175 [Agriterribacter sp.]|nr:hypothetical protein [Agriterribacter sp.]
MRQKKAKALRKLARKICGDMKIPHETNNQYKKLKKGYKVSKGHI